MSNSNDNNTLYCETGLYWDWDYDPNEAPTREYLIQPFDNTPTGKYRMISDKIVLCPACDGVGYIEMPRSTLGTYSHVLCQVCAGLGILRNT